MNLQCLVKPVVTYVSSLIGVGSAAISTAAEKLVVTQHTVDIITVTNMLALGSFIIAVATFAVNTWLKIRKEKRDQALWEKEMEKDL